MNAMQLDQLLNVWEKLAERERKCLIVYGMRVLAGQKKFGPMTVDKRDWPYEALEEALDASVYLTAALNDRVEKAYANMVSDAEKEVAIAAQSTEWAKLHAQTATTAEWPGKDHCG